jgi:hypothetical protein
MVDNLARFERMAQRAAERGASYRAIQARERAEQEREWEYMQVNAEELSRQTPEYLAGPPDGSAESWEWAQHPSWPLSYSWWHGAAIDPETRPYSPGADDPEPPFPCEFCTHPCHGSEGLPLPLIAYA